MDKGLLRGDMLDLMKAADWPDSHSPTGGGGGGGGGWSTHACAISAAQYDPGSEMGEVGLL